MYIAPLLSDLINGKFVVENINIANALAAKTDESLCYILLKQHVILSGYKVIPQTGDYDNESGVNKAFYFN